MKEEDTYEAHAADIERQMREAMDRLDAELAKLPPWIRKVIDPRMRKPKTIRGRIRMRWDRFVENVRYLYRLQRAAREVATARARYRK